MKKDYKQEPQKTKNWGSLSSLGAAFGVLFILLGLTALEGAAVGGLMFILIGLLLFPQIKLSRWIKILGIFIFFMVIVASTPDPPTKTPIHVEGEINPTSPPLTETQKEIEPQVSPVPINKEEVPPREGVGGDTAEIELTITTSNTPATAAFMASELIFKTAKKQQSVNKIILHVYLDKFDLTDKYGNPLEENLYMGEIVAEDLDEIRKYRDSSAFSYRYDIVYEVIIIDRMDYVYLLE
ncbi:hypothetical protein BMS3Abin16_00691 [archaeon BMS3Abin16]|nr:hypothetical protein BMS3Abin16_00691 [archaeon BMS3Abin16]HDY74507.1 hypothetical protein [Euryarchaeota archaeon]